MFKAIILDGNDEGVILVRGVPFGGPDSRDVHGQYFTEKTNFLPHILPLPPVFHFHGAKTGSLTQEIGTTLSREQRKDGIWYKVKLFLDSTVDEVKAKANELWQSAKSGKLFASSGAVEATIKVGESGEIAQWLVGELSLIDTSKRREAPASFHATATPLKADLDNIETGETTLDELNIQSSDFIEPPSKPQPERSQEMPDDNNDLLTQMQAQMAQMQTQMSELTTNNATLQQELQARDGRISELQSIVTTKSAEVAMSAHTGMVDEWINQGKLSPAERSPMLEVLSFAYQADMTVKGDTGFVNSVKALIEARPVNPVIGEPSTLYSNVGNLNGGMAGPGGEVNPEHMRMLKRYAEVAE